MIKKSKPFMKPFCLVPDGSFYFIRTFLHRNKYLRRHYWKNHLHDCILQSFIKIRVYNRKLNVFFSIKVILIADGFTSVRWFFKPTVFSQIPRVFYTFLSVKVCKFLTKNESVSSSKCRANISDQRYFYKIIVLI